MYKIIGTKASKFNILISLINSIEFHKNVKIFMFAIEGEHFKTKQKNYYMENNDEAICYCISKDSKIEIKQESEWPNT